MFILFDLFTKILGMYIDENKKLTNEQTYEDIQLKIILLIKWALHRADNKSPIFHTVFTAATFFEYL